MNKFGIKHGFTLIELLIVVAIIAVLAAIAVPNFMEAQTRSKVSRTKADMRTLGLAMEAYRLDNNAYIAGNTYGVAAARPGFVPPDPQVFERLSTPVAYITNALPQDPFVATKRSGSVINGNGQLTAEQVNMSKWTSIPGDPDPSAFLYRTYLYISTSAAQGSTLNNVTGLTRVAVDDSTKAYKADSYIFNSASPMQAYVNAGGVIANSKRDYCLNLIYDPSNGTNSFGQIWRAGGSPSNQDNIFGAINQQR